MWRARLDTRFQLDSSTLIQRLLLFEKRDVANVLQNKMAAR